MVNRPHNQATKLTLTQVTIILGLVSWLPVPTNTPFLTQNRHGSLRMPGYKLHPKFRFFFRYFTKHISSYKPWLLTRQYTVDLTIDISFNITNTVSQY